MAGGITRRTVLGVALVPTLPLGVQVQEDAAQLLARRLAALVEPEGYDIPIELRGQLLAWNWTYLGRAAFYHLKATHDDRFRDIFVRTARAVMAQRDDRLEEIDELQARVVKSWGSMWPIGGKQKRITDVTVTGLV